MKKLIIDRIEEGRAVCEDESGERVILDGFPPEAGEGDVIVSLEGGGYSVDTAETARLREAAVFSSAHRIKGRRRRSPASENQNK